MARPVLPTVERVPHASAPAADPCSVPRLRAGSFTGSEPQRAIPDDRCSIPTAHAPSRPPLSSGAAVLDPTEGRRGAAGSLPGSSLPGCGPRLPAASRKCMAHACRRAEGSEIKSHWPVGVKVPGFWPGAERLVTGDVCGQGRSVQPTEGFGFPAVPPAPSADAGPASGSSSTHWGLRNRHVGSPARWPLLEAVTAEGHGAVSTGRASHVP